MTIDLLGLPICRVHPSQIHVLDVIALVEGALELFATQSEFSVFQIKHKKAAD